MTRSEEKRFPIRPATLSAINDALSAAYAALLPIANEEHSERRTGLGRKACAAIEKAQRELIKDTRP